jgi:hypothetical protein
MMAYDDTTENELLSINEYFPGSLRNAEYDRTQLARVIDYSSVLNHLNHYIVAVPSRHYVTY